MLGDGRAQQQGLGAARGDTQRAMNSLEMRRKCEDSAGMTRSWEKTDIQCQSGTLQCTGKRQRATEHVRSSSLIPVVSPLFGHLLPLCSPNCMTACAPLQWQQAEAHHLSFSSNHNVGRACSPCARNRSSLEIEHM